MIVSFRETAKSLIALHCKVAQTLAPEEKSKCPTTMTNMSSFLRCQSNLTCQICQSSRPIQSAPGVQAMRFSWWSSFQSWCFFWQLLEPTPGPDMTTMEWIRSKMASTGSGNNQVCLTGSGNNLLKWKCLGSEKLEIIHSMILEKKAFFLLINSNSWYCMLEKKILLFPCHVENCIFKSLVNSKLIINNF